MPFTRVRCALVVLILSSCASSETVAGAEPLPRSSPEQQQVSSAGVLAFVEVAKTKLDSLHSFMMVRHGHVIAEGWWSPYSAESRHELYSLSKSFTSTAVGIAIAEGKLSLDDSVLEAFKDVAPSDPSDFLKAMRMCDLLRMSAGHQKESPSAANVMTPKTFLAHPVPFKPGTHFLYNTPATFMASAMVQKATGETVLDYLKPRLFQPLGIENPTWTTNSQGISLGGYGLSLRTEDIAKFGQLYLQRGSWKGKQLVPAAWVDAATARQTSNGSNPKSDWEQGYGYQFWRARHGAYRGDGAFGQYCIVLPEQDTVIAITSGLKDMQAVLNLVWDKLLPAIETKSLPESPEAQARLKETLAQLSIASPKGEATSPRLTEVEGKQFVFASNERKLESVTIGKGEKEGELTLVLKSEGKEYPIVAGRTWKKGKTLLPRLGENQVASTYAWTDPNTLKLTSVLYETPFIITQTLQFTEKEVKFDTETNVRGKEPSLVGRRP